MAKLLHDILNPNFQLLPKLDTEEVMPGISSFNLRFNAEFTFTPDECQRIIEYADDKTPSKGRINTTRGKEDQQPNEEVRRVFQYPYDLDDDTQEIYDRILNASKIANLQFYKYDLVGIHHEMQLLHYTDDDKSFYQWHTDCGNGSSFSRKLSLVVMLSDPADYEGGRLMVNQYGRIVEADHQQGAINFFPSYLLHTVTPVTSGERWVMVNWIHGCGGFR